MDNIIQLINTETNGTTLFKYIIDKYVISNEQRNFSAEYEKVKISMKNINLYYTSSLKLQKKIQPVHQLYQTLMKQ